MRKILVVICLILTVPVFAAEVPQYTILIGWDALQRAHMQEMIAAGQLPNLVALSREGKLIDIDITTGATDTKAGWTQILTGYSPEITGVYSNSKYQPVPTGLTIFERAEKHFGADGIVTVAIVGKRTHAAEYEPGKPLFNAKLVMDVLLNGLKTNQVTGATALEYLTRYKDKRCLFFIHFVYPDHAGHKWGENSWQYTSSTISDDVWLGRIVADLKRLGLYEKTALYVTSDHGFDEGERTHHKAPHVWFCSNDKAVVAEKGDRADIAPTILKRLGIPLDAIEPPLTGRALN